MTIEVNDTTFPGFVPDGRDVTPVYEQVLDLVEASSYANSNVAQVSWPPGIIGLRRPRRRSWYDPSIGKAVVLGWHGASGSRGTTFLALEDCRGHFLDHYKAPEAEYTDFAVESAVEQCRGSEDGALFFLDSPTGTKVRRVRIKEGYRNLQFLGASGLILDEVQTLGGGLSTPNADAGGRPFKAGSHHIFAQEGGDTQNNGVEFWKVRSDPVDDPVKNSNYESSWCVRSMDGLKTWGGHTAGGCYAQVLLQAIEGQPLNGIQMNCPHIDREALRGLQVQGDSLMQNLFVNGGIIQLSRDRNVSIENARSTSVILDGVTNELAGGMAIYVANGNEFYVRGGIIRANNTVPTNRQTTVQVLATRNWEVDTRIISTDTRHSLYVGGTGGCENGRWRGNFSGHTVSEVEDEGNNRNCRRGEW